MTELTADLWTGDCLQVMQGLPAESVHCVVTSPPYWGLRDYGVGGQIGHEPTPEGYVEHLVEVFRQVWRVLRKDGTCWLNLGDSYATSPPGNKPNTTKDTSRLNNTRKNLEMRRASQARRKDYGSLKPKDLVGVPWRVAFALQADGWWLRSDIVWAKGRDGDIEECGCGSPMPESVGDRPIRAHEYVFLLTKSKRYYYDAEAVRVMNGSHGHNLRDVWLINPQAYEEAHFATFPERLVEPCIKAGTSEKGCCPECGKPWVRVVEERRVAERDDAGRTHSTADQRMEKAPPPERGWRPGCKCGVAEPEPCTVFDPFSGAGTTGLVALKHGRHYVGIELSPEYVRMSARRLRNEIPESVDVRQQRLGRQTVLASILDRLGR